MNSFTQLNETLNTWFYQPDLQAIRIVLGTAKAHYLNIGDPAWLFVVAPPGTGKTTTSIMSACGLPEVVSLGDVSENTFLSGFYKHKEPGVLEKLGKTTEEGNTFITEGNALFLVKDFTTVLSMRREKRKGILSQLREIHDGEFKRSFGTGETKIWQGRVTIIAAVLRFNGHGSAEPSNFLAISFRCHARIVSGRTMALSASSAWRPKRLPMRASVARSGSVKSNRPGILARKIRFSAARYSLRSRIS